MSKKILVFLSLVFITGVALFALTKDSSQAPAPAIPSAPSASKPLVVVTLFPLEDWVKNLTHDQVEVINIIPDGLEPHDYEPTAADLRLLSQANLVLGVGGGLDDELLASLDAQKVWRMSDVIESVAHDPHVWLSLKNAHQLVLSLGDNLEHLSPGAVAAAKNYALDLSLLEERYQASLSSCKDRNLFVAHDAFHYLAADYGFQMHPITYLSDEAEPSARSLATLTDQARTLGVTTIYFETLTSPKLAETLASEVGLQVSVLDPLEGLSPAGREAGQTYLGIMEQNLTNLLTGQRCL